MLHRFLTVVHRQKLKFLPLFNDCWEKVSPHKDVCRKLPISLRHDLSVAASLCVFIRTNPFKETDPQYEKSIVVPLTQPSDDTTKIVSAALRGLKSIYRPGFGYKKSGVLLMGLHAKSSVQRTLFDDPVEQAKSDYSGP